MNEETKCSIVDAICFSRQRPNGIKESLFICNSYFIILYFFFLAYTIHKTIHVYLQISTMHFQTDDGVFHLYFLRFLVSIVDVVRSFGGFLARFERVLLGISMFSSLS